MTTLDNMILEPVERTLTAVGLGDSPFKRALAGAGIGAAIVYGLKPSIMFMGDTPRPFIWQSDDPNATMFPYWAGILLPAVVLGVFV